MGIIELLRMFGALALVIGLLVLAIPILRRHGHKFPGFTALPVGERQLQLIERLQLDTGTKRQLLLVRAGQHEHLILISPEGVVMTESRQAADNRPENVSEAAKSTIASGPVLHPYAANYTPTLRKLIAGRKAS